MIGFFAVLWGLSGAIGLLGYSVYRLTPRAIEAFSYDLTWYQWLILILYVLFMAYSEGYRGFQKGFSPRVAARAKYLYQHPRILHVLLSPFFCIGYFYIRTRQKIVIISLTVFIIILVVFIRLLDQPWRGIIDAGVVVGLMWGLISLCVFSIQAFTSEAFSYSPEVPEEDQ